MLSKAAKLNDARKAGQKNTNMGCSNPNCVPATKLFSDDFGMSVPIDQVCGIVLNTCTPACSKISISVPAEEDDGTR